MKTFCVAITVVMLVAVGVMFIIGAYRYLREGYPPE